MRAPHRHVAAVAALATASCNAVLGIDHDYSVAPSSNGAGAAGAPSGGAAGEAMAGASGAPSSGAGGSDGGAAAGGASGAGGAAGAGGALSCPEGKTACHDACVDTSADLANCGACDSPCAGRCYAGGCQLATAVALGSYHTCALLSDSSTWCWGNNEFEQIVDPADSDPHPSPTFLFTSATQITAGYDGTCLFGFPGKVTVCWGSNTAGNLAIDPPSEAAFAENAMTPVDMTVLSLGGVHGCAIAGTSNGTVWCWGDDTYGELGSTMVPAGPNPVAVAGIPSPIALASGRGFSCALSSDGSVWCWGSEESGELGNGVATHGDFSSAPPAMVKGLPAAKAIAAGEHHVCIVSDTPAEGSVHCWGDNGYWQCGTSGGVDQSTPVQVVDVGGAVELAAGRSHTCARTKSGSVTCWGDDSYGQLGLGSAGTMTSAKMVAGIEGATAIAAGGDHTCAIASGGGIWCWGYNGTGAVGDGTTMDRAAPVRITW